MEQSLASLTYKGSIPEAINEAKKQKKLFVVYISGEDTESINLENTTWTDLKVAESIWKYCILLHVPEGSTDAANFCAIYPQNSIPCITAIGFNGVQVWKSEGFVSAEDLASSLEKAWLSLHIQETTATVLTAALASNKSEPPTSRTSVIGSSEQGSSSGTAVPSPSLEKHIQSSETRLLATSAIVKENDTESGVKTSSKSFSDSQSGDVGDERSTPSSKKTENLVAPAEADPENSQAEHMKMIAPAPEGSGDHHSSVPTVSPTVIPVEANEVVENERADDTDGTKVDALGSCGRASDPSSKKAENLVAPAEAESQNSQAEHIKIIAPATEGTGVHHSRVPTASPTVIPTEANEVVENERAEDTDGGQVDALGSSGRASESTDVHLNIRLPNGVSLREKFPVTSTLGMVKDYVDRNQSGISSYDLAIPYPRRIFTDEDLSRSLSELSLFNRQALIVVPHQKASGYYGGGSSSPDQTSSRTNSDSSNVSEGGYFAYIRRLLSYANPFSYLSGGASSSSSGQGSQTDIWEYGPNPTLQNNLATGARPNLPYPPNQGTSSGRNESKKRPQTTSRFGSNIHTLKHDEDDSGFRDRNAFWNGNSTQYGSDNNGR